MPPMPGILPPRVSPWVFNPITPGEIAGKPRALSGVSLAGFLPDRGPGPVPSSLSSASRREEAVARPPWHEVHSQRPWRGPSLFGVLISPEGKSQCTASPRQLQCLPGHSERLEVPFLCLSLSCPSPSPLPIVTANPRPGWWKAVRGLDLQPGSVPILRCGGGRLLPASEPHPSPEQTLLGCIVMPGTVPGPGGTPGSRRDEVPAFLNATVLI